MNLISENKNLEFFCFSIINIIKNNFLEKITC